ncbi:SDR family oxidoreductase [Acidovorax sp. RAC01]|uniref:SDR family oxidoreductase n=1 Tax=Acidovorax sp. RAC01 TaxID=1842533 RepID=UPI00083E88C2|nr:SDR family oxidoreductase [Acidovorax sp. RAC01]AOG22005.1 short chain dehydrogenase family protein [Acidovorax sp. RAC01]
MAFLRKNFPSVPVPSPAAAGGTAPACAQVVVITGASSGIGHATALAFAARGASLVLAARNADTLAPVAMACRNAGAAAALGVPTDVTDPEAVAHLASTALRHYGRIDVWVNGVGVGAVGRFDETPLQAHRQVVETNLIGHLNGAHAALRHFRERGRGTLINMISVGGWVPAPFAAAYTASKFGLRGLSESLRAEVSDLPDVHVCDVAPTWVDSPGLSHGANYTGHHLHPRVPLLDPRRVAHTVVALAQAPRPRAVTWMGAAALPGRIAHAVAPQGLGAFMRWATSRALNKARPMPHSDGNLFTPSRATGIDGGQRKAQRTAVERVAALGVLGLAIGIWAARRPAAPRRGD